ncbi:MAG: hypothetical protein PHE52_02840, partial [Candidatus Pacebacteria bacterium]|nr:hypothetical protein [Candidatus Paceibacterota bacterium]
LAGGLLTGFFAQAQTTTEGPLESCTIRGSGVGITDCPGGEECVFADNSKCGICCLLNALYSVTDWIFVVLIALAGIFIVMGAMNIIMSGGDPSKVSSGRQYIMYAMIGLLLGFLTRAIPGIVRLIVGAQ